MWVERIKYEEDPGDKVWKFRDAEAAYAWLHMRARQLSSEGTEIYVDEDYLESRLVPDERLKRPLDSDRCFALERMMKW